MQAQRGKGQAAEQEGKKTAHVPFEKRSKKNKIGPGNSQPICMGPVELDNHTLVVVYRFECRGSVSFVEKPGPGTYVRSSGNREYCIQRS